MFSGLAPDLDLFDAELFGIAPAEAQCMAPHQRLMLEVAHEALGASGIPRPAWGATQWKWQKREKPPVASSVGNGGGQARGRGGERR